MGTDKALLPLGSSTVLNQLLKTLEDRFATIVLVGRPDQRSRMPGDRRFESDLVPDAGPLAGILTGLRAVEKESESALVLACDSPLFVPAVAGVLEQAVGTAEAAMPWDGERWYGLTALYRTSIAGSLEQMLQEGLRRLQDLPTRIRVRPVDLAALRSVDPQLRSLLNANSPAEYHQLLQMFSGSESR